MSSSTIKDLLESVAERGRRVLNTPINLRAFPCRITRVRSVVESRGDIITDHIDFGSDLALKTDMATRNKMFADLKEELKSEGDAQVHFVGNYSELAVFYSQKSLALVESVYKKKLRYKVDEKCSR
jgi:hypothetical protein